LRVVEQLLVDVLSSPRVVVTGGAGFIGSTLVDRLVDEGLSVLVVDDLSTGHLDHLTAARAHGELQFHQLDVRDELFGAVLTRFAPAAVFHLAAQSHPALARRDPAAAADVNVRGAINVIHAAVVAGVDRLVYVTSACELYTPGDLPVGLRVRPRPRSPVGVAAEAVLGHLAYEHRTSGLDYVALGTSTVFGPRQSGDGPDGVVVRIASSLLAGKPPAIAGDGSQTRDLVFAEDVADAAVRAAVHGGRRYLHVASGVEISMAQLVARLGDATGYRPRPEYLRDVAVEPPRSCFDPSATERHLGWCAWTPLPEGLRLTVEWLGSAR
jgi:UDP-glucose 4-epimerase